MSNAPIARRRNVSLWIAQSLLAALFLFAGGFKLVAPAAQLAQQSPIFAPAFLKFIGACEVFGAFGLVLPGIFRVKRHLTPLAASGLVIIMIGAVVSTIAVMPAAMAIMPAVVGVVAFVVARGRWSDLHRATPGVSAPRRPALASR
ncbi:MAG TPA: DoxX family protein [Gemmatimonadaceae bacterium]|nr:DoxX family protein [Gemmatimonadaceae bacterium]